MVSVRDLFITLWWAQVTVTPDAKRTAVLRRGMEKGLIGVNSCGRSSASDFWCWGETSVEEASEKCCKE